MPKDHRHPVYSSGERGAESDKARKTARLDAA